MSAKKRTRHETLPVENFVAFWWGFAIAMCMVMAGGGVSPALSETLPDKSNDKTLGVVTCASSLCHGSVATWKGSAVQQNEFIVWSRLDKHAKAYGVLLNEKSKQIAAKLQLPQPAHLSKVCLDCHTHNPVQFAPEHHVSDGVTCEACHGPAERWIAAHTAPDASHQSNLGNGLYPSDQPVARAQLCLSCHYGNADKYVSHRIMAAGHPRLSFELNTFTNLQPAHFKVDSDYVQRKGLTDGTQSWAIGQAIAVATQMDILLNPQRGRDGAFPELTLFDCHACHHPMTDTRWKPRETLGTNLGPGLVRLNDSSMLMVHLILRQTSPASAERFKLAVAQLNRAIAGHGDLVTSAVALRTLAQQAAQEWVASGVRAEHLWSIAQALVDDGLAGSYSDYAGAEQATMALGSVVSALNQSQGLKSVNAINKGLAGLRGVLVHDDAYKPLEFQAKLRTIRPIIAAALASPVSTLERGKP